MIKAGSRDELDTAVGTKRKLSKNDVAALQKRGAKQLLAAGVAIVSLHKAQLVGRSSVQTESFSAAGEQHSLKAHW